jgi:hypothetical protein
VPVTSGRVTFAILSPQRRVLAQVRLNKEGEAGITTAKLTKIGQYQIGAQYVPTNSSISRSVAVPVSVTVTPLTVSSFLVTPGVRRGHLGQPLTFTATALDAQHRPVTDYTGTVVLSSPTDSFTVFPPAFYTSLHISAPPPQIAGLAHFAPQTYTFTPADHGTHSFVGGVTFGKGGAEVVKVTQANNAKVRGFATFGIS